LNGIMIHVHLFALFFIFLPHVQCFQQKPWVQRNIGAIELLEYDLTSPDLAYVSSREGVLAAIHVKTGKIRWRQLLPEGEKIDKMVVHKKKLVTLSAGRITRVWKLAEGDLAWEDGHYDRDFSHSKENLGNADIQLVTVDGLLCVLTLTVTGEIRLRVLKTANEMWDADHGEHHTTPARAITVDESSETIFTIAFPEDSQHMKITTFSLTTGTPTGSQNINLRHKVSMSSILFKDQYLVMLGAGDSPEVDVMLLDGGFSHRPIHFAQDLPSGESYSIMNLAGKAFAVRADSVTHIYEIQPKGDSLQLEELRVYKNIREATELMSLAVGAYLKKGSLYLCSVRQNFDGAEIEWYDVDADEAHKQMVPFYDHEKHGDVLRVFPHVSAKGTGRAIILSEDYALTFAKNGNEKPLWVREESLAMISDLKIIDFPIAFEGSGQTMADTFASFPVRLMHDIAYVRSTIGSFISEGFGAKTDPDIFGFRKLIVALASNGKIFGIDSLSGKILQKKFLPTLLDGCVPFQFFELDEFNPVFAIVSKCENRCKIIHFDMITEEISNEKDIESECKGVFRLPERTIGILDDSSKLSVIPEAKSSVVQDGVKHIVFHNVDYEEGKIVGHGVNPETMQVWPSWTVDFGPEETIIKVHQRDNPPKVADTLYRPGGTRAVMLKYLNPHMIVVITQVKEKPSDDESDFRGAWFDGINVYLIDTVTGAIIDHIVHQNAVQPVALVTYENRVVYSFWNREKQHNVVIGLSLWLKRSKDKTSTEGWSSYTVPKPEVLQKGWLFWASPITRLSVSESKFGFAGKTILASMESGQIYSIASRFVDPRQVDGDMKTADKEEGLMPYTQVIPFIHQQIVTQGNEVAGIRGIEVGFAKVESTSLVVAFGIDLFMSLMTPTPFDMLGDDFNKPLLLTIVAAVLVAIAASKYFANDAKLRRNWT